MKETTHEIAGQPVATTIKPKLAEQLRQLLGYDTARIVRPIDKMFLIVGTRRNTKDDPGHIEINGERVNYDYVAEQCVASGMTDADLIASAEKYKMACGMTMQEYLKEEWGIDIEASGNMGQPQ